MDWTTIFGFILGFGVVAYGLFETKAFTAFLNLHGIILVIGGTVGATFINTSSELLFDAVKAVKFLFVRKKGLSPEEVIAIIERLAGKARRLGNLAIESDGKDAADPFLQESIDTCLTASDEKLARDILVQKVKQAKSRHNEVINVFRTMAILFPMFGLIGTLIGIVTVLRNITDPKNVGTAMAVALSTAFFGILFANMVCVPIAGKLRIRNNDEALIKEIICEGILRIFFTGEIPSQIKLYLETYKRRKLDIGGVSAAGITT
ncbi:motility protein A [Elusimicrobiota bacterium]